MTVTAAKHSPETYHVSDGADNSRNTRGDRAGEDVSVIHVHQLMSQNPAHFSLIKQLQDTFGAAYGGVLRVTAGSKRIRGLGGCHVQAGHRLVRAGGELFHNVVEYRHFFATDRVGVHGTQGKFIGVPVGVGYRSEPDEPEKPDEEHAAGVRRDNRANKHKEPHHSPHEQGGFEAVVVFVHFSFPVSTSHAGVCSGVLG